MKASKNTTSAVSVVESRPTRNANRNVRITKCLSIRPDQDIWLAQTLGDGNVSKLVRGLLDAVRDGRIDPSLVAESPGVVDYLKARRAGSSLDRDIGDVIAKARLKVDAGEPGEWVVRRPDGGQPLVIAGQSDASEDGVASAAARLLIAKQTAKAGAGILVVPYLRAAGEASGKPFAALGIRVVEFRDFEAALERATK